MDQDRKEKRMEDRVLTIPNLLSVFRLCLIPIIVWLYCVRRDYPLTASVLLVSGATDIVDGIIARQFGMISNLGKVLDPVADKLTQGAMLMCLITRFHWMALPLGTMVVKEAFMGLSGIAVVKKTGQVFGADWHGKVATVLLYAMMLLHVLWYDITPLVSAVTIGLCTGMIGLSLVLYAAKNFKALREEKGTGEA